MKLRASIIAFSLLLLSGCGTTATPIAISELSGCSEIPLINNPAKTISMKCLDGSDRINLAAIKGPAIINVWGSWCTPCKEEIPYFVEFNKTLKGRIQIIGVDVEEKSLNDGADFARSHGMSWPNLYDADGVTREHFGMGVPVTWFVDATGKVRFKKMGPVNSVNEIRILADKYLGVS